MPGLPTHVQRPPSGQAEPLSPMALCAAVLLLVALPVLAVWLSLPALAPTPRAAHPSPAGLTKAVTPPPAVEPVRILALPPETARAINAAVPFSTDPNPAARPFRFSGDATARARATDCLAAAQYYEAGDDADGQKAVAQVVLNRLRHPAFPKTVCAVVFQGAERTTGCQFTFTCDGALGRTPPDAAWQRARALAAQMLDGKVDRRVGHATHYHTDWVVPYWSGSLDKITAVGTHLFFRWRGWWGTPPAFGGRAQAEEPVIAKLAALSPAHRPQDAAAPATGGPPDFTDLARPALAITRDRIGDRFGPGRLLGLNSTGDAFLLLLDRTADPASYEGLARQLCGGRTRCRMLGWTRAADAPNSFPVADDDLRTMSYAYIRMTDSGLERSLFNCTEFPPVPQRNCMRERAPEATPPAGQRSGKEKLTVTAP